MEVSKLQTIKCFRCSHVWVPRKEGRVRICPKCKSPYFDVKRKVKK